MSPDKEKKLTRISIIPKLLPYFFKHFWGITLASLTTLVVTATRLGQPIILRKIIDVAVPNKDLDYAIKASTWFIGLLILGATVSYIRVLILNKIGMKIIAAIKSEIFAHCLNQGMRFFDKTRVGTLITRTESDVDQLKPLFSNSFAHILSSFTLMLGIFGIVFMEQPKLGFFIVITMPFGFAFMGWYINYIRAMHRKVREKNSEMTGYVTEYIQGVPLIQLYNRKNEAVEELRKLNLEKYSIERKLMFIDYAICWPSFNFIFETLALIAVFYYGSIRVYNGEMSCGTLILFIELMRQFFQPLREMAQLIAQIQSALGAGVRIFEILETPIDVKDEGKLQIDCSLKKSLKFEYVSFAYEKEKVLDKISFTVNPREHIAIVGASGSGKTTIANLLLRFYDPTEGYIKIDEIDIKEFPLENWRQKLGLVLQEVYLFPGTIMENLKAFNQEIPDEKVIEAAKIVGAHDFIMARPEGYNTQLAERGANFSQGERQLLSYTRALVKNPEILILDEATASVDLITEKKLQQSMENLLIGRTAIIIAHRLSTIRNADKILVLEKGRIVEEGTNDELMNLQGIYWKLVMLQAIKESKQ